MTGLCVLLAVFSVLMFFVGSVTENCATWAIRKRIFQGGQLLHRRSHFADQAMTEDRRRGFSYWLAKRVPHFAWADPQGVIWQYTVRPEWEAEWKTKPLLMVWLSLWFYDGRVVQGDPVLGETIG